MVYVFIINGCKLDQYGVSEEIFEFENYQYVPQLYN